MNKKAKEVKQELSPEELVAKLNSALAVLKIKNRMGQLAETHQIKKIKKEIARLLTEKNKPASHLPKPVANT